MVYVDGLGYIHHRCNAKRVSGRPRIVRRAGDDRTMDGATALE